MASMAQSELNDGCTVVLDARDPATGAVVTGVVISDVAIYGLDLLGNALTDTVPLLTIEQLSEGFS